MSIAFPAVLVFLFVLPGIILRYTYARGPWSWASPTSLRPISDEIAYSVAFAVGLHAIWIPLAASMGPPPDLRAVLVLLIGSYGKDSELLRPAIASVVGHPVAVTVYFLSLYATSGAIGLVAHRVVRRYQLDLRTRVLRFKNEWYYLLTGEILSFNDVDTKARPIDGVYLSAVVDHGKRSFLYRGIVEDWTYDRNGELDKIVLSLAHRRDLDADKSSPARVEPGTHVTPDERYYPIRGDFFVLRYAEVRTLNLDYFTLEEQSAQAIEPAYAT